MSSKNILHAGQGDVPNFGDSVTVSYIGTMTGADGSSVVFDQTTGDRNFTFDVGQGQVIQCWDEQVGTMKVGEKAMLTCPARTAYGEQGVGAIPGDTELRFEVERKM